MNSSPSPWSQTWQDVNFGYMHEDPEVERHFMPASGNALCVLSAGDIAYALASPQRTITAVDINPAQLQLHRLRIAASQNHPLQNLASSTIADALNHPTITSQLTQDDISFWQNLKRLHRPLIAAGQIDARLRFLSRWVTPHVLPPALKLALQNDHRPLPSNTFRNTRWNLAWSFLKLGILLTFPLTFRHHLPSDLVQRLKYRFEQTCLRHPPATNPHLQRLLSSTPIHSTDPHPITIHHGTLEQPLAPQPTDQPFDLITTSNIFDTSPPSSLSTFLKSCEPSTSQNVIIIVRSLFRNLTDWPPLPPSWRIAEDELSLAQQIDQAPLCHVSLIIRRSA